jgi:DNA end-binding protein Ku
MQRPLWSGTLTFGIVTIPVRLYPATRDHDLHFHQISRRDRKRIRYLKVAAGSSEEVPAKEIVKGFEVRHGQYVVFEDEEFAKLAARKSRVIDLERFVSLSEIDPLFFDRPYLLAPDEDMEKPYGLLAETLERTQRIGIAQMVMHGKEHVVAIRSLGHRLYLHTLRYADEVLKPQGRMPAAHFSDRELTMAERLVDSMEARFDPTAFSDSYRKRLQDAIKRKSAGKKLIIDEEPEEADSGKVINLLDALERSLKTTARKAAAPAREKPATPVRARRGKPRVPGRHAG